MEPIRSLRLGAIQAPVGGFNPTRTSPPHADTDPLALTKAALVVLAGNDSHADMGRATNALETARQFQDAGDEATRIFHDIETTWLPDLHALLTEGYEVVTF